MKNLTKKTIATLILLATFTSTGLAGDTHCPKTSAPCFADIPTVDKKIDRSDKTREINYLKEIVTVVFKNLKLIF